MTDTPFARKPTLTGERVLLRPVTRADAEPLLRAMADREVLLLTGMLSGRDDPGPELAPGPAREWYGALALDPERLDLAVVEREGGTVVGEVVLNEWDPSSRTANFRTLVGPTGRGRGLGTEAIRLLLTHAFDTCGLHRVELEVFAFNERAIHVYESVGFVAEGRRREVLRLDDEWHDAFTMALLERDWATHRGRPGPDAQG